MFNSISILENRIPFFLISKQRRPKQLKIYTRFVVFALLVIVANSSNVNSQPFPWSVLPGHTRSTPALAYNSYLELVRIVARASDNSLWTATFHTDGTFNNDWVSIPGSTPSTPALAVAPILFDLMVVRDSNGNLWKATFSYNGPFNNDWQSIPGNTPNAPALIKINNGFLLVVTGFDNSIWTATFNSTGVFNNDWEIIPGSTPSTPALAWDYTKFENAPPDCPLQSIMIVVRDSSNHLWKGSFDTYGNFRNDWTPISGMTPSSPALGNHAPYIPCSSSNQAPGLVVRSGDDALWQTDPWYRTPGATPSAPAVLGLEFEGIGGFDFWIVVRASDDSLWIYREY